jgi:predicted ArsR family transcriptional regulator
MAEPQKSERVSLASHETDLLGSGGLEVLSALIGSPSTIRQLALRLNVSRAHVKYVVDKLMERGLVVVHLEAREVERVEAYYVATAQDVTLAMDEKSSSSERLRATRLILDTVERNTLRAFESPSIEKVAMLKLAQCRVSRERAQVFATKLQELLAEFHAAEDNSAEETFGLAFALFPTNL